MLDMSWGEVMVIGGVALIVIGPKDLPRALRTVGQMTSKVRRLAGEFQSQFNEAMREAELEEVRRDLENVNRSVANATSRTFNPIQTIRDELKGAIETPTGATLPVAANAPSALPAENPAALPDAGLPGAVPVVEEGGAVPQIEPAAPPAGPAPHIHAPMPTEPAGPGLEGGSVVPERQRGPEAA
ncbi:MAG: twin-arginine translocase subunit TatB [Methylobacteriaceae bacterium]|nr:twin-arginine translocase subunit TatB [Methylobacteriaceae bacterium]